METNYAICSGLMWSRPRAVFAGNLVVPTEGSSLNKKTTKSWQDLLCSWELLQHDHWAKIHETFFTWPVHALSGPCQAFYDQFLNDIIQLGRSSLYDQQVNQGMRDWDWLEGGTGQHLQKEGEVTAWQYVLSAAMFLSPCTCSTLCSWPEHAQKNMHHNECITVHVHCMSPFLL